MATLQEIKLLQKEAGMKTRVPLESRRPRVADLTSTKNQAEIGKVHRQLAVRFYIKSEEVCIKKTNILYQKR